MTTSKKPTIFSGVQPTGNLHLGNYLGAISQWAVMQEKYQSIFCIVDYHAITVRQDAETFRQQILNTAKVYLAAGIENMTQFKDKSTAKGENVSVGLFDYPVLMAADILLYGTDAVPVGDDQKQHVELARDLAKRFNHDFGETFKIPEVVIRKEGARIMGLDNPKQKMSKSASPANYIALTDSAEINHKKIMRAVTDSGSSVTFDKDNKPAIANLLTIYSLLSGNTIKNLEHKYRAGGYGDFKKDLAEVVTDFLADFQQKFNAISDQEVRELLKHNAELVRPKAQATIEKVKKQLGL
jgi:tryptophanyl-tRNA synthetase